MNIKKIVCFSLLVFVLTLTGGNVLAETAQNKAPAIAPVKYTDDQRACMKTAQEKMSAAVKQATETFKASTSSALKAKEDAVAVAQKIKNKKNKESAVKTANQAYGNNEIVKQARIPYMNAIKNASEIYKVDQKACLGGSANSFKGFFRKMGDGFSNFGFNVMKFFKGKK